MEMRLNGMRSEPLDLKSIRASLEQKGGRNPVGSRHPQRFGRPPPGGGVLIRRLPSSVFRGCGPDSSSRAYARYIDKTQVFYLIPQRPHHPPGVARAAGLQNRSSIGRFLGLNET